MWKSIVLDIMAFMNFHSGKIATFSSSAIIWLNCKVQISGARNLRLKGNQGEAEIAFLVVSARSPPQILLIADVWCSGSTGCCGHSTTRKNAHYDETCLQVKLTLKLLFKLQPKIISVSIIFMPAWQKQSTWNHFRFIFVYIFLFKLIFSLINSHLLHTCSIVYKRVCFSLKTHSINEHCKNNVTLSLWAQNWKTQINTQIVCCMSSWIILSHENSTSSKYITDYSVGEIYHMLLISWWHEIRRVGMEK